MWNSGLEFHEETKASRCGPIKCYDDDNDDKDESVYTLPKPPVASELAVVDSVESDESDSSIASDSSSAENISVHSDDEEAGHLPPLNCAETSRGDIDLNRYTVLCQHAANDLYILMSDMQAAATVICKGLDAAMIEDDSQQGLTKEFIDYKTNSNERIGLYLAESMTIVSKTSVGITNLLTRLVLASNLRDEKQDPRCKSFKFSDNHFKIAFAPCGQMNSQTGPGSNVYLEYHGTRTVNNFVAL